ncbi:iron chaperone [Bifidobacterium sp.]|jgi:uncharacterized protein YdhG (YjbR/CyaY superfamily)|uniref:iron chaperone n=1 Tax=Bifidobacterium sp. TaxID=41200 RepID=UPI0025C3CA8E|nr:DUF1801 domain-containing protein [Bifidobacterium sp.]MCH4209948.1 hypothetical protein [Bifidobacterium sp.]MCI1225229.1 hypothetical protein [Bifidobacterium sp.]
MLNHPDPADVRGDAAAVADYIEQLVAGGDPRAETVAGLYRDVRALVPSAAEGRSYGMPALVVRGKASISVVATAKHVGVYPYSGTSLDAVRGALRSAGIPTTKGAIQLPNDTPLPSGLLERLIEARLQEIEHIMGPR